MTLDREALRNRPDLASMLEDHPWVEPYLASLFFELEAQTRRIARLEDYARTHGIHLPALDEYGDHAGYCLPSCPTCEVLTDDTPAPPASLKEATEAVGRVEGPTIYSVVMDERTTDLSRLVYEDVDQRLRDFRGHFVKTQEEAVRAAYVRGVRDGFAQGVAASTPPSPWPGCEECGSPCPPSSDGLCAKCSAPASTASDSPEGEGT